MTKYVGMGSFVIGGAGIAARILYDRVRMPIEFVQYENYTDGDCPCNRHFFDALRVNCVLLDRLLSVVRHNYKQYPDYPD